MLSVIGFLLYFVSPAVPNVVKSVLEFALYFSIGKLFSGWRPNEIWTRSSRMLIGAISFVALEIACLWLHIDYFSVAGRLLAIPMSFGLIVAFASLPAEGISIDYLSIVGRNTMTIFCLHVLFTAVCRIALIRAHVTSLPIQLLIGTSLAVLLPLLLKGITDRLGLSPWLGLPAPIHRFRESFRT